MGTCQQMGRVQGGIRLPLTPLDAQYHDSGARCVARSGPPRLMARGGTRHTRTSARRRQPKQISVARPQPSFDPAHVPGIQTPVHRAFSITKDPMKRFALSTHATRMSVFVADACLGRRSSGCDTLNDWLAPDRVSYKAAGKARRRSPFPVHVRSHHRQQTSATPHRRRSTPAAGRRRPSARSRRPAIRP